MNFENQACNLVRVAVVCCVLTFSAIQIRADGTEGAFISKEWTTDDGLPQSDVTSITQAQGGYLWVGTLGGLARFDGARFRVFDQEVTIGLDSNHITALLTDLDDRLWIGTASGLTLFENGTFTSFTEADGLPSGEVRALAIDPSGSVFIGTSRGVVRRSSERFERLDMIDREGVTALLFDRKGRLYVGTEEHGLISIQGRDIRRHTTVDGLPSNHILSLAQDRSDRIIVGTRNGVVSEVDARIVGIPGYSQNSPGAVSALLRAVDDSIWMGTAAGLVRTASAAAEDRIPGGIAVHDVVSSLYEDSESNIWVGTDRGLVRLRRSPFLYLPNSLFGGAPPLAVSENRNGDILAGTQCAGLWRVPLSGAAPIRELIVPENACVWSILVDPLGSTWVGTSEGLYHATRSGIATFGINEGLQSELVLALAHDLNGVLWVGTRNGLSRLSNGDVTTLTVADGLPHNWIRSLLVDPVGRLWIGTAAGLAVLANDSLNTYTVADGLSNGDIRAVALDESGSIWIGTFDGGLNRLSDGRISKISMIHGLAENRISVILDDGFGSLWMAGNRGIQRVNKAALNRLTGDGSFQGRISTSLFGRSDGLRIPESTGGFQPAGWSDSRGRLWFPTAGGLAAVDPGVIGIRRPRDPVVESIVVDGERVLGRIPRGQRNLEIRYTSIHLASPEHVRFQIMLDGFDDDWVDASNRRSAFYRNLPPGSYTFRVRSGTDGVQWNTAEGSAAVIIPAFFHETIWFYLLTVLSAMVAIAAIFRWHGRRSEQREEDLLALVEVRTRDLDLQRERAEEALGEAEQQRERAEQARQTVEIQAGQLLQMDKLKSRFFANISHEFRTPLTLITSPLEQAVSGEFGELDDEFGRSLSVALRNAHRLLRLINQLMDLARIDAGAMALRVRPGNFGAMVQTVCSAFSAESQRLGIDLFVSAGSDFEPAFFDHDKVEKVVVNLLSNAMKATPGGGKILVSVVETRIDGRRCVQIVIKDTGVGIEIDQQSMVFNRFHQIKHSSDRGTGIGLSLVKELVELHHGEVSLESVPGYGSTFTVTLPAEKTSYSDDETESDQFDADNSLPQSPEYTLRALDEFRDRLEKVEDSSESHVRVEDVGETRPHVLVVEDNKDVRDLVHSLLRDSYAVTAVENGGQALRLIRTEAPDLIVSDLVMPDVDGIELCRAVRSDRRLRHTPIILLTARSSDESRLEGLQVGADAYLTKPFRPAELTLLVDNLIRRRQAMRDEYSTEVMLRPYDVVVPSADAAFIERVSAIIDAHLEDPAFGVTDLSEKLGVSQSHLKRKLSAVIGEPPNALIRRRRLERAAQLLKQRAGNVSEIAFAVGFDNLPYFAKCFREQYGIPPSKFARDSGTST